MGYNFKFNLASPTITSTSSILPETAAQEADRHKNAEAIRWLRPPAMRGSEKQIAWAIRLFEGERYFWHGYGLKIADIELFLATPEALSASWWITTCKDSRNGMIATGRIAVDAILVRIKQPSPTPATLSLKLKVGYPDRKVA